MAKPPFPFIGGGIVAPTAKYSDLTVPMYHRMTVFSCKLAGVRIALTEWRSGTDYYAQAVRLQGQDGDKCLDDIMMRENFTHIAITTTELADLVELLGLWSQVSTACSPLRAYLLHPAVQRRTLWLHWKPLFMNPWGDFQKDARVDQLKYYLHPVPLETEEEEEDGEGEE